ncbi:MAG TPA: beta-ketoacyl-[acyl-carrier-protein] synthase family protein, partial [Verrucomicrobiales bacterium]|nr:beta-ketoacyl-[acyl-carrier-protein] synthase family protein [Verrucomicrobiales bacterium]
DEFASKIAAEVKGFDWSRYFDPKRLKRYDKTIRYGVAAARMAIEDSGIGLDALDPDRKGIVEGTTVSGLETVFRTHASYLADGPGVVNPISVVNGYCGEGSSVLALELGMHAHAVTYCSGCCSSNDAIGYAAQMI